MYSNDQYPVLTVDEFPVFDTKKLKNNNGVYFS